MRAFVKWMSCGLAVCMWTALSAIGAAAQDESDPREVLLEDYHLKLTLPALDELTGSTLDRGQLRGSWSGKLGDRTITIEFIFLDFNFSEPGDVSELIVDHIRGSDGGLDIDDQYFLSGEYGFAPFAACVRAGIREKGRTDSSGTRLILAGLLEKGGYAIQVDCRPKMLEEQSVPLAEFFEHGVVYTGPKRDREWSKAEITARWKRDAPEDTHEDFEKGLKKKSSFKKHVIRTDNYIIFTNSSGGKKFAQKMEENYDEIVDTFPFDQVEGRKLMPVFLFRMPEEYYGFYMNVANTTRDKAARSKGHAWRDYYATWYEAPGDPVHIHEATHQIFSNRLRLGGGGSWFQEGVAEYVETKENARNAIANLVKKGRHTSLREFMKLRSLLYSSSEDRKSGGSEAGDHYKQAALLIEFLRDSNFGKKNFEEFMTAVGKVPRSNLEQIEAVMKQVYGVTIDELDLEFQAYCKKR